MLYGTVESSLFKEEYRSLILMRVISLFEIVMICDVEALKQNLRRKKYVSIFLDVNTT